MKFLLFIIFLCFVYFISPHIMLLVMLLGFVYFISPFGSWGDIGYFSDNDSSDSGGGGD